MQRSTTLIFLTCLSLLVNNALSQNSYLFKFKNSEKEGQLSFEDLNAIWIDGVKYSKDTLLGYNFEKAKKEELPIKDVPTKDNTSVYFDTVINVSSATKKELYYRIKLWFADNFKSSKSAIDYDDIENGIIVGKGNAEIIVNKDGMTSLTTRCFFTLKVSVKDSRYRIEIYDFRYKPDKGNWIGNFYQEPVETYPSTWFLPMGKSSKKVRQDYKDETISVLNRVLLSIKGGMEKSTINEW